MQENKKIDAKPRQKKKNVGGRPTKLTKQLQTRICAYVRAGNYIETAAAAAGINKTTLYDWLKRGANEESGIYKDFSEAVSIAIAQSEVSDLKKIDLAAKEGNWTAAAWRLERRFNDRWGRKDKLSADVTSEHTEKEELVIEQRLTADEEGRELLRQLFRRNAALQKEGQ